MPVEDVRWTRTRKSCLSLQCDGPKFVCDRQCSEECFKFYDIALIMVEDDGEPHTINFCLNCYT